MMLSGNLTPFDSMPEMIQKIMYLMPTSYFVQISQAILFRGAGLDVVWDDMLHIFIIGLVYFLFLPLYIQEKPGKRELIKRK